MKIELTSPILKNVEKLKNIKPSMAYSPHKDIWEQQMELRKKYRELLGITDERKTPPPVIEYKDESDERFDEIRFYVETEPGFFVPCHMLIPKNTKGKLPVCVCLQGHSEGMNVSLGREAYPGKGKIKVEGDRDFCIQAVNNGYIAVAMEQRGFGELKFTKEEFGCHELSWQAALMGRTLAGDRVHDILSVIDAVITFPFADEKRIAAMGNSGGGTSSYYAACIDERIKVTISSSSFCGFAEAWGSLYHCDCGYIPGILKYMDMPDMAVMIAPRPLIVVNGKYDHIQPFASAVEGFEKVKQIYAHAGSSENARMVIGEEGHRFYGAQSWKVFNEII